MAYFENIDIKKLLEEDEDYLFPPFTEKDLEETEKAIGWKLPKSYIALLKIQNGGYINYEEFDECWLSAIYGISSSEGGLIDMFDNWINEWEYPNIGIPFGETQSAGHDMYFMDFSSVDENGEPRIVHIDNEADNSIDVVADNLEDFLTKICHIYRIRLEYTYDTIIRQNMMIIYRSIFSSLLMIYRYLPSGRL